MILCSDLTPKKGICLVQWMLSEVRMAVVSTISESMHAPHTSALHHGHQSASISDILTDGCFMQLRQSTTSSVHLSL